jgi:hypothetical protein
MSVNIFDDQLVRTYRDLAILTNLTGVGIKLGGDLGLQGRRPHLACALAHDLIQRRPPCASTDPI